MGSLRGWKVFTGLFFLHLPRFARGEGHPGRGNIGESAEYHQPRAIPASLWARRLADSIDNKN